LSIVDAQPNASMHERDCPDRMWENAHMAISLSRTMLVVAVSLGVLFGLQAMPFWAFLAGILLALAVGIGDARRERRTR
jgi:hypothetical protein